MRKLLERLDRVAALDPTVTLLGEVGTGREYLARAMHRASWRRRGPFVVAHAPAIRGREAWVQTFQAATSGTLFVGALDESSPEDQATLYSLLAEYVLRGPAEEAARPSGTRLVVGAGPDLLRKAEVGEFREDLLLEIGILVETIPPLRERREDILPLARHFQCSNPWLPPRLAPPPISDEVGRRLEAYPWPHNVAELENCVYAMQLVSGGVALREQDLPPALRASHPTRLGDQAPAIAELTSLADVEANHIQRVLGVTNGNKAQTARILGVDRTTLYRKLERYAIDDDGNPLDADEPAESA